MVSRLASGAQPARTLAEWTSDNEKAPPERGLHESG